MVTRKKTAGKKTATKKTPGKKKVVKKSAARVNKASVKSREKNDQKPGIAKVVLEENVTISNADELKKKLLKSLRNKSRVELDGAKVEVIDTAGLQVLVAFILHCRDKSLDVQWLGKSEILVQTSDILGLSSVLEL